MNLNRLKKGMIYWASGLLILLNIAANSLYVKWDITDHKNFTLSPSTIRLLSSLREPAHIDILFDGSIKATDKKFARSIREILVEFQSYSHQPITFNFINPFEGSMNDSARAFIIDSFSFRGIKPYTLRTQNESILEERQSLILPGAIIGMGERKRAVNFFEGVHMTSEEELFARSEALLEYQFASAIEQMNMRQGYKIYFTSGNKEPMDNRMIDFFRTIALSYSIDTLNLYQSPIVPKDADLLFVFFPSSPFSDEEKMKIDQYIINGGRVIFVMSSIAIDNSQAARSGDLLFINQSQNLEDALFQYGCRVESSIVKDLQCASMSVVVGSVGDKPQISALSWPYYPVLNPNAENVITKNIDPVLAKYATWIDTLAANADGLRKTILLSSSNQSQSLSTPRYVSIAEAKDADPILFTKKNLPVAVLIEGQFRSLYYNRLLPEERERIERETRQKVRPFSKPTSLIVISNPQLFINEVSREGIVPMGYSRDMQFNFANKVFLLNSVAYMCNPNGVIAARKKDFVLQLLDAEKVKTEASFWRIVNFAAPLVFLLFLALFIRIIRHKYA